MVYADEELEYEVINDLIMLVKWPMPTLFTPKKRLQSKKSYKKIEEAYTKTRDSLQYVYDTTNFNVYLINELGDFVYANINDPTVDSLYVFNDTLIFCYRNLKKEKIKDSTELAKPAKINLIYYDRDLIKNLFKNDNFGGVVYFSRMLFNENKSIVIFEMNVFCGTLCGWGNIVIAKKINGKWETIKHFATWVS